MRSVSRAVGAIVVSVLSTTTGAQPTSESVVPSTSVTPTGAITLAPATIPFSSFASPEALAQFVRDASATHAPALNSSIEASRRFYDAMNSERVELLKKLYPVTIASESIGGVQADVVIPAGGVGAQNQHRVLINLHGGAFLWGAHSGGLVESIPIASRSGLKVISVDYRQGPEHTFPAASVDVAAVYAALLKQYRPQNIGIYGTSAGGVLAAESIAWIAAHGLPTPGAVATLCGSALELQGDSAFVAPMLVGQAPAAKPLLLADLPYFKGASSQDSLVFPGVSTPVLAGFPPTLLITGTRDFTMSSVVRSHALLVQAGVDAELHVYEGMWHAFLVDPALPESRSAYDLIARFFNRRLSH